MAYQQLTLEERSMLYGFCKAGFSNNQIAQELGRHKSAIGRELKRNKGMKGYRPKQANEMAKERKQTAYKAIKWAPECEHIIVPLLQYYKKTGVLSKYLIDLNLKRMGIYV